MWSTNGKTCAFRVTDLLSRQSASENAQGPRSPSGNLPESAWHDLPDGRRTVVGFVYVRAREDVEVYALPRHLRAGEEGATFTSMDDARAFLRRRFEALYDAGTWPDDARTPVPR